MVEDIVKVLVGKFFLLISFGKRSVQMAGERGIYSLLDMHQDAFNRSSDKQPGVQLSVSWKKKKKTI